MVKVAVERKEAVWKVSGTRDKAAKVRCMEAYKEEMKKVKRFIYQNKKRWINSLEETVWLRFLT